MSSFLVQHPIESYPQIYKEIRELKIIAEASHMVNCQIAEDIKGFREDMYFDTASLQAIERYERMAKIQADQEKEDLEFRRERVKNRFSMSPPFTRRFLVEKINSIIGIEKWSGSLNAERNILTIETSAINENWYYEIFETVNIVKPVNMQFILKPTLIINVCMTEMLSYSTMIWNYRLGKWRLGRLPFITKKDNTELSMKGGEGVAIKSGLVAVLNQAVLNATSKILINDSIEINEIESKIIGNDAIIEYRVSKEPLSEINNIKTLTADNTMLTNNDVYIPLIEDVSMKHKFGFKGEE